MSTKHLALGVDLNAELKRYLRTPALKPYAPRRMPKLMLYHPTREGETHLLNVTPQRVSLNIRSSSTLEWTLVLLLWAAVQASCPNKRDRLWCLAKYRKAAEELFGATNLAVRRPWHTLRSILVDMHADGVQIAAPAAAPPPKEPTAKLPRIMQGIALVKRRAAHAKKMQALHTRKLKIEERLVRKWTNQVRLYEKRMAAREPVAHEQAAAAVDALIDAIEPHAAPAVTIGFPVPDLTVRPI